MRIEVHNRVDDFNSYRAARVKSLFNAENGCNFDLEADIDLSGDWQIGVVVGPSGSGKSSKGRVIFGENLIHDYTAGWSPDKPIIDDIAPDGDFNEVTGALANVLLRQRREVRLRQARMHRGLRLRPFYRGVEQRVHPV